MKSTVFTSILIAAIITLVPLSVMAGSETYTFGVSDQRTTVTFESETDFETILGSTNKLSGTLNGDLKAGTAALSLALPVASLNTGIDLRDEHIRSEHWLDAGKYPEITFVTDSMKRASGDTWKIKGKFTMHGVTKPIKTTVTIKEIPATTAKKAGLESGNWIRATAAFSVKLSDFGVKIPDMAAAKVNDEWTIKLQSFAGTGHAGAMKKAANPCNPCGGEKMKKAANPCNPCGGEKMKKAANPCNPCG